jgi:malonyl-CoA/methylmalonyl-CoA synthetase
MNSELSSHCNFPSLALARMTAPDKVFVSCDDGRDFTYQQFWDLSGRLASALAASGAKRGDRVAVQVEKSVEAIALFWACVRGGLVFLPLNTAYTPAEISYFLEDAEPSVFVGSPVKISGSIKTLTLDSAGGGSLVELARGQSAFEDAATGWNDLAAILYTSGTTGRSKGAMLTQGNLASNALALIGAWKFTADDVLIHALPVYHTHGLFVATNTVFLSGGTMLYRRSFDAADVLRLMPQATCMMGVPTFYTRLLAQRGLTREAARHMRLFVSGSAPLLAETHRTFFERTGHAILERYGMTETSMNTSNPYDGERRAGTVGFPLPGIEVRINGKGVIEIKGPNVFAGYWRNPEKTKEDMTVDGWFITGDAGHFDADGYLVISGRAKDLVISGGFNVYPKEVELLIDAMEGVIESAVIGVPHADFGEAVFAVVATHQLSDSDGAGMIRVLRKSLAPFKVPKRIVFVSELPRNAMGKVQKAVLRETYKSSFASPASSGSA